MKSLIIMLFLQLIADTFGTQLEPKKVYSFSPFEKVIFYNGYGNTVDKPTPPSIIRLKNTEYATRIKTKDLAQLQKQLSLKITVNPLCDNYDRLGGLDLFVLPEGAAFDKEKASHHLELARLITPFMNKNKQPSEVPYNYNISHLLPLLESSNDFWLVFKIYGVPYAAQKQVKGCAGRTDTFMGTVKITTTDSVGVRQRRTDKMVVVPICTNYRLNNYKNTDKLGKTIKVFQFKFDKNVTEANLYLITSSHGANKGGEEYKRREHLIYVDDKLVHKYTPGGESCEAFRKYNTQGNGIYGRKPKTAAQWASWNNWCPGDKVPVRKIRLGKLKKGAHQFKICVPDAEFVGKQGSITTSAYIAN